MKTTVTYIQTLFCYVRFRPLQRQPSSDPPCLGEIVINMAAWLISPCVTKSSPGTNLGFPREIHTKPATATLCGIGQTKGKRRKPKVFDISSLASSMARREGECDGCVHTPQRAVEVRLPSPPIMDRCSDVKRNYINRRRLKMDFYNWSIRHF